VTTVWNNAGYSVDIGDGDDPNGYMEDGDIDKTTAAYYGHEHDERGAYLYHAGLHMRCRAYTGADTIDTTVVTGTATQGEMKVWVAILRLK
jgi:hypothetical protein